MPSLRHAAGPVSDYLSYCEKAIGIPPAGYNNLSGIPGALVFCSTYRDATSLPSKILNDIVFIFLMEVRILLRFFTSKFIIIETMDLENIISMKTLSRK